MKNIQKNSILIVFCLIMSFLSALEMQGRIRLVTRDDDNITAFPTITGSLRWAIVDAQDGDTIVIASAVTVISLNANIPIQRNNLIITKIIGNIKITNTGGFDDLQFFNTNPATSSPFIKVTFNNIDFEAFGNIETRAFYAGNDAQNCDVRFVDCSFEKFKLTGDGVVILMVKGDLTLKDCIFRDNQIIGTGGTGIVFTQNTDNTGNALFGPHKLKIIDCKFVNNKVGSGTVYTQAKNTTIQWCTFENNQVFSAGGAIVSQSTQLTITDCIFTNNSAETSGGAIYILQFDGSENASIERCYFEGNKTVTGSNSGGAIYLTNIRPIDAPPSPPSNPFLIKNCTFWKNEAYEGGGIFLRDMTRNIPPLPRTDIVIKRVDIISNTFVGNIARNTNAGTNGGLGASQGGAIFAGNASDCFLDYNVAIENKNVSSPNSKDFVSENGFKTQAGNNVYQTDDNSLVFNTTLTPLSILNSNLQTTATISGFVTPQENGGFSKTFKPALGNNILVGRTPAVGGNVIDLPKLDQRLFPRGTTIDVGACEKTPNPTGEIPEGVFMEITACNAINTATANAVKLEWRDRLDLSTDNYIVLRNNVNIATVTKQTGRKQVFSDENPIIGTPVTYQIQANKKPTFQIDKYKSQKATISLFNDAISATDALNDKEVSIYPNPCKEKLFVSLEKTLNLSKENKISIFSIFGQKIISQNISLQQTEVVLPENLRVGLYFVEIKQGEKRSIKKIIIE